MPDSPAIDDLFIERFRAYLKLLASSQLHSWLRQRVDASDLVQQTMLDAVAHRDDFHGTTDGEFLGWLKRILVNNLVDAKRHHGRGKRDVARDRSLDAEISQSFCRVDALALSQSSPSQKAATNEQLLRLPDALEQLSSAQRDVIVLHHLQGLTLTDTAERIGRSEAAVGGLLYRGLERLNELLDH